MKKILLIVWIISIAGFAGYKVYEHFERQKAIERGRAAQKDETAGNITTPEESEKPVNTVIPSTDKFFPKKKVYTNEDIRKLNEKKKKKGVITNEEMKKYHRN
ncbi:MAG TPA: hypothetical protein P5044_06545 [bacterium]|nr:hypothetical protein [bacterium]